MAAATGLLLAWPVGVTGQAQAAEATAAPAPRVVAEDLNNPRQLSFSPDGRTLMVAEAGRGGTECTTVGEGPQASESCTGPSGSVTRISSPAGASPVAARTVSGLRSDAGPNGAFAVGTNGVDEIAGADRLHVVAQSPGLAEDATPEDSGQGAYIVADAADQPPMQPGEPPIPGLVTLPGGDIALLGVDLADAERRLNPDRAQIESNPYGVVFVDEDPADPEDGYVLVADAAANTVWKIAPDEQAPDALETTVFVTYPTTADTEAQQGPPEFVPTSLAVHGDRLFVGGLGSEIAGAAQVVEYDLSNRAEVRRFTGFTGITGVAADAGNLYVSQLFGPVPPGPPGDVPSDEAPTTPSIPGSVVKVSRADGGVRTAVDVPFPAGIALDAAGNVYVAVNSIAPADGVSDLFGPDSFDVGGGAVWDLDFTGAPRVQPTPFVPPLERLAGADRYATAARVADSTFDTADTVVLASGAARSFPDALTGNYLAGREGAPILLTEPTSLPAATRAALDDLDAQTVLVVGGPAAVSASVAAQLDDLGYTVERLGGADRYATAALVAREVGQSETSDSVGEIDGQRTAILGSGQNFPDILAAGPISYAEQFPIAITRSDTLLETTRDVLTDLGIERVIIVGGPAAVSARVQQQVEAVVDDVVRIAGPDRFGTATRLAAFAYDELDFDTTHVDLARSDDFADALAGGPHSGEDRAPIVLTPPTSLHPVTRDFLAARSLMLVGGHSFGGPAALSPAVVGAPAAP